MQNELQNKDQKRVESNIKPEDIVRYFKYYKRQINTNVRIKIALKNIQTKTCYKKHKKTFDKLCDILNKYGINHVRYVKFCITKLYPNRWCEDDPKSDLLQIDNFKKYLSYIKEREQYFKIYKTYMKTVDFISDECIKMNLTPVNYMKYLILNNKLAYEYFSGNISQYFIASIQNFKEIYKKLDILNKEELKTVYNICDELNKDVQNAFLMIKSHQIKPLALIQKQIENKQNRK